MTDILECVSISQIQQASAQDDHLQHLKGYIIAGWPGTKDEAHNDLKPYWYYRDELAVIDGVVMKGRCIIIPTSLKQQVLDQLHTNQMGIEKTKLLACESVYWADINVDTEKHIRNCVQMQPKGKIIHYGTNVFHFNKKTYLCIVDYHSKFPMAKRLEGLSAENLITAVKVIFTEYGIPCKVMSDAGTNFVSDKFQTFCNSINIEQLVSAAITTKVMGRSKLVLSS